MKAIVLSFFNLGLLVALLVWKTRKPLKDFVVERAAHFKSEIKAVSDLLNQAKVQNEEFTAKLKAIDAEVVSMRQAARLEAEQSSKRIAEDAKKLSVMIVTDSRRAAEAAGSDLKEELRVELAGKVIASAESQIRAKLTGDDRARIRQEFSRQVGTVA